MAKQLVQTFVTKLIACAPELQRCDASEHGDLIAFAFFHGTDCDPLTCLNDSFATESTQSARG